MLWSETSAMDQRTRFIADYPREMLSVTELQVYRVIKSKAAHLAF